MANPGLSPGPGRATLVQDFIEMIEAEQVVQRCSGRATLVQEEP